MGEEQPQEDAVNPSTSGDQGVLSLPLQLACAPCVAPSPMAAHGTDSECPGITKHKGAMNHKRHRSSFLPPAMPHVAMPCHNYAHQPAYSSLKSSIRMLLACVLHFAQARLQASMRTCCLAVRAKGPWCWRQGKS